MTDDDVKIVIIALIAFVALVADTAISAKKNKDKNEEHKDDPNEWKSKDIFNFWFIDYIVASKHSAINKRIFRK